MCPQECVQNYVFSLKFYLNPDIQLNKIKFEKEIISLNRIIQILLKNLFNSLIHFGLNKKTDSGEGICSKKCLK